MTNLFAQCEQPVMLDIDENRSVIADNAELRDMQSGGVRHQRWAILGKVQPPRGTEVGRRKDRAASGPK